MSRADVYRGLKWKKCSLDLIAFYINKKTYLLKTVFVKRTHRQNFSNVLTKISLSTKDQFLECVDKTLSKAQGTSVLQHFRPLFNVSIVTEAYNDLCSNETGKPRPAMSSQCFVFLKPVLELMNRECGEESPKSSPHLVLPLTLAYLLSPIFCPCPICLRTVYVSITHTQKWVK